MCFSADISTISGGHVPTLAIVIRRRNKPTTSAGSQAKTGPVPSGKRLHNYGTSPFLMGQLTISMAMFNSYFDITRG